MGFRILFSEQEQDYIIANAPYRASWGALARDLERKFPEDNGGKRNSKSVRNWYRIKVHGDGESVKICADVPKSLAVQIQIRGLTAIDVGKIIIEALRKPALI